ncbi:MAG: NAD(P)-dependent oxidoreductase [Acidobacteria bacterium]|nr:NAD(P)-dependent oxidoreductase [Acidobacteriota bacterium]
MNIELKLGFVGFGEAGYHLAKGLRGAGLAQICAYDIHTKTPGRGEKIQQRARETEVRLCESNVELAARCNVLFSTVTANQAAAAAEQTALHLTEKHIYADLNSVSPDLKRAIAERIEVRCARFVEIAIMSPVPPHLHQVPMFLGGAHAQALVELLTPFGMKLEIISEEIGAASATKMCRSIIVKGLEALLFECVLGAVPYGADDRVFATLEETMPGMNWKKLAGYMVGRVIEHGERRARELEEVAATLRAIGVEPLMTEAIVKRQDWGAAQNLLPQFGGKAPEEYRAVVNAIRQSNGELDEPQN